LTIDLEAFSRAEERKILEIALDHVRKIEDAVLQLVESVKAWINHDVDRINTPLNAVRELEDDADKLKRQMIRRISGAMIETREDLLRLIFRIDSIGEYAEGAAFYFDFIKAWRPPKHICELLDALLANVLTGVSSLKNAVRALGSNVSRAIRLADQIDAAETTVDGIFRSLTIELSQLEELEPKFLMSVRDFLERVQTIADIAEDASDAIRILAVIHGG
jgi:predicted phosphate transport protein (TIGR00153 family)